MRRTQNLHFRMGFKFDTGLWAEDFMNDYYSMKYQSSRQRLRWYYTNDRMQAARNISSRAVVYNSNNDAGLHPATGYGAFERELERKGIPVDKYPLPTTTSVKRLHESVLLRRAELEKKSAALLASERAKLRQPEPSSWYDETNGPLNKNFLARYAQQSYDADIVNLPRTPIQYSPPQQQQQQQQQE